LRSVPLEFSFLLTLPFSLFINLSLPRLVALTFFLFLTVLILLHSVPRLLAFQLILPLHEIALLIPKVGLGALHHRLLSSR
jgi:hypothetical protein